jgi:hypothetical protein
MRRVLSKFPAPLNGVALRQSYRLTHRFAWLDAPEKEIEISLYSNENYGSIHMSKVNVNKGTGVSQLPGLIRK